MEDLEYCGEVPLTVTQEQNTIRYLSECIWGYETGNEVITYYGRDVNITLTCWANGTEVMGDPYWYKVRFPEKRDPWVLKPDLRYRRH